MTTPDVLESIKDNAALITGVSAALVVLWRYVFSPVGTAIKSLKKNSEGIAHFLPALSSGQERWPSSSGSGSFLHFIDTLDSRVTHIECRSTAILDISPSPMYECSPEGNCVFANDRLCDLFGLSNEEMMGSGWLDGIEPIERERVYSTWKKSVEFRIPYECTYTVRNRKTGSRCTATTRAIPLQLDGNLIGYLGVFSELKPIEPKKGDE